MASSEFDIKFSNIKKDKKNLDFEIGGNESYGLDKSIINGIRRTLLTNINTIAFNDTDIIIKTNKGALHNEFLKHRITLIPLYIEPNNYYRDHLFVLKKKITDETILNIRVDDFEIYELNNENKKEIELQREYPNENNNIFKKLQTISTVNYNLDKPLSKSKKDEIFRPFKFNGESSYFLITELKTTESDENVEEIELYCSPSSGTSKEHSRFNNVSKAVYSFKKNKVAFTEYLNDTIKLNKLDSKKNFNKAQYEKTLELKDGERYYYRDNNNQSYIYNFGISSNHIKTSKELFIESINILINRLNNINENLKLMIDNSEESLFSIDRFKNDTTFQIIMLKEDDTTGNIIQSHMVNKFLNGNSIIQVCGYKKPHPLTDLIIFNIMIKSTDYTLLQNKTFISEYFIKVCNDLIEIFDIIKNNASKKL